MRITGTLGDRAGFAQLKQALEAYALRHRVIAGNIANAEVEGYQPRRVEFERRVSAATPRVVGYTTDPRHLAVGAPSDGVPRPRVTVERPAPGEPGGVDLEKEMVALAENQLAYRLAVRLLDMKYNTLSKAITGRTR